MEGDWVLRYYSEFSSGGARSGARYRVEIYEREEREERRERVRLARCGLRVRVALCLSGARWVSWTLFRGAA